MFNWLLICSDAILLVRAPQYANKFEDNTVKFEGSSLDELNTFVKENLCVKSLWRTIAD